MHAKSNGFLLRNSFSEKPICWSSKNHSMASEVRASRTESLPNYCRYRSVLVKAMGKKNPGNPSNSNSNSSSSSSGKYSFLVFFFFPYLKKKNHLVLL